MAQACTICGHPERDAIDHALVGDVTNRRIAAQYQVSASALRRHKAAHLSPALAQAAKQDDLSAAIDVMVELKRCFLRINKLSDACDAWLTDPDDASRYTLEPRAHELQVVYTEPDDDGKPVRKKARLSALLAKLEGKTIVSWEARHADPRDLVLKTAAQLNTQLQLVSDLMHREQLLERLEALERVMGAKI